MVDSKFAGRCILVTGIVCVACSGSRMDAYPVVVGDSAGVEVVSVPRVPAMVDAAAHWTVTLVRSIPGGTGGSPTDPVRIYNPVGAARFPDGTLVVLDKGPEQLLVIDPADSVVARFAPSGHGPGEIYAVDGVALLPDSDRTVTAVELWGNVRIHHFSLAGDLLADRPIKRGGGFPWAPGRTSQELSVAVYTPSGSGSSSLGADSVAHLDATTGTVTAFAPLPPRFPLSASRPTFYPIALWTAFPSGAVITGMTDSGTLRYINPDGSLERIIHLPLEPRSVTPQSKAAILEENKSFIAATLPEAEAMQFYPQHRLALRLFTVDNSLFAMGHRWYTSPDGEPVPAKDIYILRMYHVSGRPDGIVEFPGGFSPWSIVDRLVLGVRLDSLGVPSVQEYRLDRPG